MSTADEISITRTVCVSVALDNGKLAGGLGLIHDEITTTRVACGVFNAIRRFNLGLFTGLTLFGATTDQVRLHNRRIDGLMMTIKLASNHTVTTCVVQFELDDRSVTEPHHPDMIIPITEAGATALAFDRFRRRTNAALTMVGEDGSRVRLTGPDDWHLSIELGTTTVKEGA